MSFSQPSSVTEGTTSAGLAYDAYHQRYKMCTPNCTSPTATTYYMHDPMTGMYSERVVAGSSTTWNDYIVVPGAGIVAVRIKTGGTISWRDVGRERLAQSCGATYSGTRTSPGGIASAVGGPCQLNQRLIVSRRAPKIFGWKSRVVVRPHDLPPVTARNAVSCLVFILSQPPIERRAWRACPHRSRTPAH